MKLNTTYVKDPMTIMDYEYDDYMSKDLNIELIDNYGIDGDFVESQAFAYIAIRSVLKLPITFPKTTGCDRELTGGEIIKIK